MKTRSRLKSFVRLLRVVVLAAAVLALPLWAARPAAAAAQWDIAGPAGSGRFGETVTVLPNGNIVVTDPGYDVGGKANVGAVYLYEGATGTLISALIGGAANDQVGSHGVTVLSNGNYVVISPYWDNGGATDAGAVTWGNGGAGASGQVSAANSLVGATAGDLVGYFGVTALSNGNYIVRSPYWGNGATAEAGAVTWGNGATGVSGQVSAANSLVGSTADDWIGAGGVTALSNGNYVVPSSYWDNGATADAGAVTWGSGATGVSGQVSAANSLVGSAADDHVGSYGVEALSNGNYVVISPDWDNGATADAGAATWGNGITGVSGSVSAANSLVGNAAEDRVSSYGVTALSNGNYVVRSPGWHDTGAATWGNGAAGVSGPVSAANSLVGSAIDDRVGSYVTPLSNGNYVVISSDWDNGGAADAGAATWGNGATGISGQVSAANSLVGSAAEDSVGSHGVTALSKGNYVVISPDWDNGGIVNAGAVTWGKGVTGISGPVSTANSLVGATAEDRVGASFVTALSNGHYVVLSYEWDNGGIVDAGAATWASGATGLAGQVSAANSLVGSQAGDQVGIAATALRNGNYVVRSPYWDNGGAVDAGAVTWGNGITGVSGPVSAANSLVGSAADDGIGHWDVTALSNGNYVVGSPYWDNGGIANAGAVTWGNGATGISGPISAANSLVGSAAADWLGDEDAAPLDNGHYVVRSAYWDNVIPKGNQTGDAGAVTWGNGWTGVAGPITGDNSVRGTAPGGGQSLNFAYDPVYNQLVVGRPADNIVTLFRPFYRVLLPVVLKNGS